MKIIGENDDYDPNGIVLIEALTYYKLKFLIYNWILKTPYISKPQISQKESMTIIQLNLPQEMKEEILIKAKNRKFKDENILNGNHFRYKSSR